MYSSIRNIGIIAHVDHGKTTLVDQLFKAAGMYRANEAVQERAMDSMDLEREKGITIRAKNASIQWKDVRINIVDTPGHADFGGEVERILRMVDGVLLLVDAADGPQAQTRFVLRKALENKLKLIVLVNKIDRDMAKPHVVHDQVLELLLELHADDDQFNAPFLYGSARDGYVMNSPSDPRVDMSPLLDAIVAHIPPPDADNDSPFKMVVSNLDWSDYVGRIALGKIASGHVETGDAMYCIHRDGRRVKGVVTKLFAFSGMQSDERTYAGAGDIVGIAGFDEVFIGETLCANETQEPIPFVEIDPPTISMQIGVNNGPLAGRDGKLLTARQVRERLIKESRTNVSISVEESDSAATFTVSARGELQIAVLVETMRREGFEVLVSRPEVINRVVDGKTLEPYEDLWVDLPGEALGDVMQNLAARRARIGHMEHVGARVKLEAVIPTRGLIGFESYITNRCSGEAIASHMFREYAPLGGEIPTRTTGTLVSMEQGAATAYALDTIQQRGKLFIKPGDQVYEGMIVGENARADDLPVNPTRAKQLTNIRASGADKAIQLEPPIEMSLERAIEFIANDEYVEATPKVLRLRKKILNANMRKRANQAASAALQGS